jgi:hypothetical protein
VIILLASNCMMFSADRNLATASPQPELLSDVSGQEPISLNTSCFDRHTTCLGYKKANAEFFNNKRSKFV